jgi:hypothetical protein
MSEAVMGGCLCGSVRYQCGGEPGPANYCHCEDCRRCTVPPGMWLEFARRDLPADVKLSDCRFAFKQPSRQRRAFRKPAGEFFGRGWDPPFFDDGLITRRGRWFDR